MRFFPRPIRFIFQEPALIEKKNLKIIGWREWLSLPDLGIATLKAKVDTGARTSSLHAIDLEYFKKSGKEYIKFKIQPQQRSSKLVVHCSHKVLEHRKIKSSNGQIELRPVIETNVSLFDEIWPVELTLTNRDEMGFRMLLGRESIRKRFLVDSGNSYLGAKAKKPAKKKLKRKI